MNDEPAPIARGTYVPGREIEMRTEANVLASVSQLSHSSPLIEGLVGKGKMKIIGAMLELSTGCVHFFDI